MGFVFHLSIGVQVSVLVFCFGWVRQKLHLIVFLSDAETTVVSTFLAHAGPAVGRAFVGTASCFLGIEALGRAFRLLW